MLEPKVLRKHVLHMAYHGQAVHIPCAFSMIEICSLLYSKYLRYNPKDPLDPERDFLALSKGHGVMAVYACMRQIGWLGQKDLDEYFKDGSALRGLSESNIPGLEVTSGSLGHGLPVATGIALGLKLKNKPQRVFCVVGDGEMNEGPMWEACLFANQHRLGNLFVIVDANGFQAMGKTQSILSTEPFVEKFKSFGFEAAECDGHDLECLDKTISRMLKISDKPKALVARTVKGKGVSFMENDNSWHYTRATEETLNRALKELDQKEYE